ncbi:hypothetical protein Vi05172_g12612 [Venturia inaequalis]|nr:hypothetical protein Vi05172_g12612 [Venturia inaequalis]
MSLNIKLLLISIFSISSVFSADTCYWPNGAVATESTLPCSSLDSSLKHCCAKNEACLSNGMCFSAGGGGLYRGACTDQSWTTIGCPQFCNSHYGHNHP